MSVTARPIAESIETIMESMGRDARAASRVLARSSGEQRNGALRAAAASLRNESPRILEANARDLAAARTLSAALRDRLELSASRIENMAEGLEAIASQPDPLGRILAEWTRPNGLRIARVPVPLGVIGVIYESRPNVTADAGGLCLKAGNAVILKSGSESFGSSRAILDCVASGLASAELPAASIQHVPVPDRRAVYIMLRMNDSIDLIVPRGGRGLIERVVAESRIPVLKHLDGLCHTYVDRAADLATARRIVLNAKMRRTGICGATETLLIDRLVLATHLSLIVEDLIAAGCEVRGDDATRTLHPKILAASEADWNTEYLAPIIAIKTVDGVEGAIRHIARHGTGHTEAIITADAAAAERFLREVDAAIVMHNASTQFADGGEFGMGAEIGISTDKLHARGPVGAEQLTSYKYVVRGDGQVRP
jgi:glutamate-5-semialdehyde dehydrogenase